MEDEGYDYVDFHKTYWDVVTRDSKTFKEFLDTFEREGQRLDPAHPTNIKFGTTRANPAPGAPKRDDLPLEGIDWEYDPKTKMLSPTREFHDKDANPQAGQTLTVDQFVDLYHGKLEYHLYRDGKPEAEDLKLKQGWGGIKEGFEGVYKWYNNYANAVNLAGGDARIPDIGIPKSFPGDDYKVTSALRAFNPNLIKELSFTKEARFSSESQLVTYDKDGNPMLWEESFSGGSEGKKVFTTVMVGLDGAYDSYALNAAEFDKLFASGHHTAKNGKMLEIQPKTFALAHSVWSQNTYVNGEDYKYLKGILESDPSKLALVGHTLGTPLPEFNNSSRITRIRPMLPANVDPDTGATFALPEATLELDSSRGKPTMAAENSITSALPTKAPLTNLNPRPFQNAPTPTVSQPPPTLDPNAFKKLQGAAWLNADANAKGEVMASALYQAGMIGRHTSNWSLDGEPVTTLKVGNYTCAIRFDNANASNHSTITQIAVENGQTKQNLDLITIPKMPFDWSVYSVAQKMAAKAHFSDAEINQLHFNIAKSLSAQGDERYSNFLHHHPEVLKPGWQNNVVLKSGHADLQPVRQVAVRSGKPSISSADRPVDFSGGDAAALGGNRIAASALPKIPMPNPDLAISATIAAAHKSNPYTRPQTPA